MTIIDDPTESIKEFMKFDYEKTEIELFLKDCSLKDFIWVVVTIFRDKYARGSLLGSLISTISHRQAVSNGVLYIKEPSYRNDLRSLKFKYNKEDHFEYLEFEFVNSFARITNTVEEYLTGKNY